MLSPARDQDGGPALRDYQAARGVADSVRFGISYNTAYYGVDPDMIVAVAQHADALGFESFYMPEHVALNPGAAIGSLQIDPTVPIADPLECLSFVAAATDRILLGTGVLLVPYQHPVVLAKRLAGLAGQWEPVRDR